MVRCEDSDGRRLWQRDRLPMIGWDAAPDAKTVYILDMFGTVHAADAATGADKWTADLANKGMLRALPDGDVLFGGLNGLIVRLAPDGTERWRSMLRELHEIAGDYDAFVHDAKLGLNDISTRLYPSALDEEGDLDQVVRFGLDVVADGSFESDSAWTLPPDGAGFAEGRTGKRAVQTTGGTVTQSVDSPVIANATYLLEFHFRPQTWDDALTAGVLVQGKTPAGPGREVLTGMPFKGVPGTWNYGRLAVKTLSDSTALTVGFEARKGTMISVDDVRLRPVRFPSRNFLFNATAHAIKPRFVDDLSTTQRGVPRSLEADMIRQDHVSWYVPGGMIGSRGEPLESMILLQNGQIDDVGKMWHTQPDPVGLNVGLTSPRYISHVVVYFSHQYPGEAWPRFQVKVNDVSVKNYVTVASVRGNRRHFCVVKFDPVLTDLIYIIPVGGITQWDATVTEIEIYGPLGGPETVKGPPADPDATPMFMATPSHARPPAQVDFAAEMNVAELDARVVNIGLQPALADGKLYVGTTDGSLAVISLDDPKPREVARGGTGSLPITGTPALHSARALVPSADGCLYCLAAGDCSVQWKYRTGGRMLASALPDGDDVYAASDDGKLYKLDIESGMLLWEFQTGGRIRATPALLGGTIFVVSWDGNCYAVSKDNGKLLWKAPVAPATLSSPVAAGGNVFLGDEDGFGRCLDAATGAERWKMAVGGRVSAPAAVLEQCVVFAAEDGTVVCVGRADGKEIWRYKAAGGIRSAPLPTTGGLVVASPAGVDVLNPASGAKVKSFAVNGAFCALPCKGKLVVLGRRQAWVIQPPAVEKK